MKRSILLFSFIIIIVISSACAGTDPGGEPEPTPTVTTIESNATVEPESASAEPTEEPSSEGDGELGVAEALEGVGERTPMPTATPGPLVEGSERITQALGLEEATFLGLGIDDWLVLIIAGLLAFGVILFASWVVRRFLPKMVLRTETELDDQLLEKSGREIRWLVIVLTLQFITVRLVFLSASIKSFLTDIYFLLALGISLRIVWNLIDLMEDQVKSRISSEERRKQLAPLIKLMTMMVRILAVIIFTSILLSYFGVNVYALAAALGLGGLALSLAAKDTLADAIAGFIILIDQPFRVGDRIEIQGVGTWGDVTDIGLRTTSIRTRDNRMVIIPNSTIGTNEIVNYSYPDPEYRIQTHISIAYGTPIKNIQKVVLETMRGVDGVLLNRPIDVLYHEMGDSAMVFRVRWWIGTYADNRRVIDRVHIALQEAIDEAGFDSPFNTQTIDFHINPETANLLRGISSENDSDSTLENSQGENK